MAPFAAHASYHLFVVNPGQTRTIDLTVKPAAPKGTVVHGLLYIDDFVDSPQFLSGSQLASLPYEYTVGPSKTTGDPHVTRDPSHRRS